MSMMKEVQDLVQVDVNFYKSIGRDELHSEEVSIERAMLLIKLIDMNKYLLTGFNIKEDKIVIGVVLPMNSHLEAACIDTMLFRVRLLLIQYRSDTVLKTMRDEFNKILKIPIFVVDAFVFEEIEGIPPLLVLSTGDLIRRDGDGHWGAGVSAAEIYNPYLLRDSDIYDKCMDGLDIVCDIIRNLGYDIEVFQKIDLELIDKWYDLTKAGFNNNWK